MLKYTLDDFKNIEKNGFIEEINKTSIDIINNFSKKVGAPTYRKTPIFKKKRFDYKQKNNFKKKQIECSNIDIDKINQDKIRELLNKLTNDNYHEISSEIILNINHFIYSRNELVLLDICKEIFNISSRNKFWVELYTDLFEDLIKHFGVMKTICNNNFDIFMTLFNNIRIVSEDNYDKFCDNNMDNEKRRALTHFYCNLYKKDVVSMEQIEKLFEKLCEKIETNFDTMINKNSEGLEKKLVEEIFEYVYIILEDLSDVFLTQDNKYLDKVIEIYNVLVENKLSKKVEFKLLDVFEEYDIEVDE